MIGTRHQIRIGDTTVSAIATLQAPLSYPTILLHGWGGSAESFQPLMQGLQETLPSPPLMVALDLPGFGQSPPPPQAWSVDDYVQCVVQYMDDRGIPSANFIVHSFGGRLLTKLAIQHPDRVHHLVYLAPAGIRTSLQTLQTRRRRASLIKRAFQFPLLRPFFPLVRRLGYRTIGGQDFMDASGVMKETFIRVTEEDLVDLLPHVTQPTRIFWGSHDSYVPVSDGEHMAAVMPQATLTVFPDGKHGIHLTHAVPIAKSIADFL